MTPVAITFGPRTKQTVKDEYLAALRGSGLEGVEVYPRGGDPLSARRVAGRFRGVVLAGGGDLHPSFYGERDKRCNRFVSKERDAYEIELVHELAHRDIPLLGICRGIQVVCVAFGGKVYQDMRLEILGGIHDPNPKRPSDLPEWSRHPGRWLSDVHLLSRSRKTSRHRVKLAGLLARAFDGRRELVTNSRHHQACKAVPSLLGANAWAEDGIIEGLESPNHTFLLGVQWHPEYPPIVPAMRPLFDAFSAAVR
jgi:putative glutamine amidotransferase